MFSPRLLKLTLFAGLALSMACSHGVTVTEFPPTASPTDELQKFNTELTEAGTNRQADVLSPRNFSKASDALGDAKKDLEKGKDGRVVLKDVAKGRAYLAEADRVTAAATQNIPEIVNARHDALAASAKDNQREEMRNADNKLTSITDSFESGKYNVSGNDRSELQKEYLDIELVSIDRSRFSPARNYIAQAQKQGAEKLSPRTLAAARQKLIVAEAALKTDRHNKGLLDKVTDDATQEAKHSFEITQAARGARVTSPEDIALDQEAKKKALAAEGAQLETAAALNANKDKELAQKDKVIGDEEASNSRLQKEKHFNDSFEAARQEFKPSEAEVYRQGDNLLIRLKGLSFKSGSSELAGSSFQLLGKVKDVISSLGTQKVVVEGHTDSVGSKKMNEEISKNRADAVANYLVAEKVVEKDQIVAEGYGFDKPLASNKNKQGRAQNRRVDIIVTPTK